jgi:hypothetical protein
MRERMDKLLTELPSHEVHALETDPHDLEKAHETVTETSVITWNQFEVQYLDLITAAHYMLTMEVPRSQTIADEHFSALRGNALVLGYSLCYFQPL